MGNPKQKWTAEEEEALRAGIAKHGTGKWKNIQRDPEFNHLLHSRSNIDLKDKWRNLSIANGIGSRDKSKTLRLKANPDAPATPSARPLALTCPSTSLAQDAPMEMIVAEDSSKCLLDGKTASKYNSMISEALLTLNDPNGSDTSTIVSFIEQRHEVPQNFRKLLSSRLRRLVAQDKLEKVQNCYRIKKEFLPVPVVKSWPLQQKEREIQPRQAQAQAQAIGYLEYSSVEEAAVAAASRIAEAENKSFVAAEAAKEAERVSKMAEDTDSMFQLAQDIIEKCSRGEIVMMA